MIALSGGELVYFEMDVVGQLNEYTDRKEMGCEVICMTLGAVPQNEQRSRFLAVGLSDNTVRIISLDPSVSCIIDYIDMLDKTNPTIFLTVLGLFIATFYASTTSIARIIVHC